VDLKKFQRRIKCRKHGEEDPDGKFQEEEFDIFHE